MSDWAMERAQEIFDEVNEDAPLGCTCERCTQGVSYIAAALRQVARECAEILDESVAAYRELAEREKTTDYSSYVQHKVLYEELRDHAQVIRAKFPVEDKG